MNLTTSLFPALVEHFNEIIILHVNSQNICIKEHIEYLATIVLLQLIEVGASWSGRQPSDRRQSRIALKLVFLLKST